MKSIKIKELEEINLKQREIIKRTQKKEIEKIKMLRDLFQEIADIGHSDEVYKNIKMTDLADQTVIELTVYINKLYRNDEAKGEKIELSKNVEAHR